MAASATAKRRLTLRKSHTSPSLANDHPNAGTLPGSEQQQEGEDRFGSSDSREDNVILQAKLANETKVKEFVGIGSDSFCHLSQSVRHVKFQQTKRSKFKVLLSPRNPYEEFHKLFKDIPKEEFPINDYSCALSRDILLHGRLFVSQNWLCFYSNIFGWETQVKLECKKIKSITRAKTAYMFPNAILVRTEKKKYLFCSFLTRDAAYKLLSSIWQESVNQQVEDSGMDKIPGNGEPDAESIVEETSNFNGDELPLLAQRLQSSKDSVWALKDRPRTVSCPNSPLTHHPIVQEAEGLSEKEHRLTNTKDQQDQANISPSSCLQNYSNGMMKPVLTLLNSLYNYGSSMEWLFKRNQCNRDVFLLLSSLLLVTLLMSTFTLMNRISQLERRFLDTLEEIPEQYQKTDQLSLARCKILLKKQEARFHAETERLNQVLTISLVSIENVKTELKLIKDELSERNDIQ